ncbi:MAG: hypothetical protein A2Y15_07000 [Clostridiales bacterium GWF2_36_10]|nr:MAG: hypothetical protein A2Y15_07000 [Clostridiales bacterium GWF2_36_10]HAN21367.1 hypothetical protein [Clostridiales bacterium]
MTSTWGISENVLDLLGREPTEQEVVLLADYTNEDGTANKLMKRIGRVYIDHPIIAKAFSDFAEKSGSEMENFRLVDLLSFNESVNKDGFVYGNVGDYILCFSKMPKDKKLTKHIYNNSVNGIYELLDRTNGVAIDLSPFPNENMNTLANRRFVFANRRKAAVLTQKGIDAGVLVTIIGVVTSEKRIKLIRNGVNEIDIEKSILFPHDKGERLAVSISNNAFRNYQKGYLSVFSYKYCISAMQHNKVVLGTSGDISQILTMLLGIYAGSKVLSMTAVKLGFTNEKDISISSDDLKINYGDKIYLIKPFCNSENMPLMDSYSQINSFLYNSSMRNSSLSVYPVINDIKTAIKIIEGNKFNFEPSKNYSINEQAVCSVLIISPMEVEGKFIGTIGHIPVEEPSLEDIYQI